MSDIPKFSPGCFGSAIAFRKGDMVCRSCKFAAECEPAHNESVVILRERYGLEVKSNVRVKQKVVEQAADPTALVLSKKTMELIERLDQGNFDIVGKLQRGDNPFGSKMAFMRIACHLLLRLKEPFDRQYLTAAFVKMLGWQNNTADAHARMAIQALTHIGAVENCDGMITLRRK